MLMCKSFAYFYFLNRAMSNRVLKSSHSRPFSANRTHPDTGPKTAQDGRKYPEIKQRGFYSDILSDEVDQNLGVRKKRIYLLLFSY